MHCKPFYKLHGMKNIGRDKDIPKRNKNGESQREIRDYGKPQLPVDRSVWLGTLILFFNGDTVPNKKL